MSARIKIDFVSDVSCPWCVIGSSRCRQPWAVSCYRQRRIHFQPFELNPQMPPQGRICWSTSRKNMARARSR